MAKFYNFKIHNGAQNMIIDECILHQSIESKQKEPVLRFYGWSPSCISIGRNQKTEGINTEFCSLKKIDIVKRITGGRALLHENELTYSFVCPIDFLENGQFVKSSYKEISDGLVEGFKLLDIKLDYPEDKKLFPKNGYCMAVSTGADLSYGNKKLIGSAQFRSNGYILQHGSILFDVDEDKLMKIFNSPFPEAEVTTLSEILTNALSPKDLADVLKDGFEKKFNLSFK